MMRASTESEAGWVDSPTSVVLPLMLPAKSDEPGALGLGQALARDGRFVDLAFPFDHMTIKRDPLSGADLEP